MIDSVMNYVTLISNTFILLNLQKMKLYTKCELPIGLLLCDILCV